MIVRAMSSTESSIVKMDYLEKVQKIRGAESALGITFCSKSEYQACLPDGGKLFAKAEQFLFCFVDGYRGTVFVLDSCTGIIKPVAYDFSEFLRLIFTCGSGYKLANMAIHDQNESGEILKGLAELQNILALTPIQDPESYIKTVGQVIDCSRLR